MGGDGSPQAHSDGPERSSFLNLPSSLEVFKYFQPLRGVKYLRVVHHFPVYSVKQCCPKLPDHI